MITTNRTTRRARTGTTSTESAPSRGVPRRALADGIVERRRAPRRRNEPTMPSAPSLPMPGEALPALLSASEHYRLEVRRRADRLTGDLATLLRRFDAADRALSTALRICRERKDVALEHTALRSMGLLRWHEGRHAEHQESLGHAVQLDHQEGGHQEQHQRQHAGDRALGLAAFLHGTAGGDAVAVG